MAGKSDRCSETGKFYSGDWLKRAAAAKGGIYGNDAIEAVLSNDEGANC